MEYQAALQDVKKHPYMVVVGMQGLALLDFHRFWVVPAWLLYLDHLVLPWEVERQGDLELLWELVFPVEDTDLDGFDLSILTE